MPKFAEMLDTMNKKKRNSVRVLSGFNPSFEPIASLTMPRLRAYAERHGFQLSIKENMHADGLPVSWGKVEIIRDALKSGSEDLFWIDADALIVLPDQDIRDYTEGSGDLYVAWHGPEAARIVWPEFVPHFNVGVMFIRNTPWAHDFLARVWDWRGKLKHFWSDQAAFHYELGYLSILGMGQDIDNLADRSHIARLDCRWNTLPGGVLTDDPIVHHYAGLGSERSHVIQVDLELQSIKDAVPLARQKIVEQQNQLLLRLRLAHRKFELNDHGSKILRDEADARLSEINRLRQEVEDVRNVLASTRSALDQLAEELVTKKREAEYLEKELQSARTPRRRAAWFRR